ncbi:hypothetical protein SUGI_0012200 [Cryptomeria japonica]|uniref:histone-lysine N-methyltransferase SUVR5 isoform X2 n=1 Tax=Cryptomeria japonica TaxID=3369 RepID=UPI002408E313|nr:histone-lysine N-methyltransferase SUVR5 isoform X2 [Cryptomeria japonica]GLJ05151.1 hypothetical protein SUGI_0012200 [Cryptomeria japonica]
MSANENIDNGITPLESPNSANNDFQEGQRQCGMGVAEDNPEVSVGIGGTTETQIFLNGEQGHLKDGVFEQCVEMLKSEYPSDALERKEAALKNQEINRQSGLALWVKWRGKWQAGIQCSMDDCPSTTVKAMPTYGRKTYIVVYFPNSRSHFWTDSQLACTISEKPEPLAFGTHETGQELVKDLSIPRQYMLQKLAIDMLEASDQLHVEAVVESARNVNVWKEFAKEAAQCTVYSDLGRMLLKLRSMILEIYISPSWMEKIDFWKQECENTKTAEGLEKLTKDLEDAILWDEVAKLWNAPEQTALGVEWKTWKKESMKLFSIYNPSTSYTFERNFDRESREKYTRISDTLGTNGVEASRKRQKLEIRRGNSSEGKDAAESQFIASGEVFNLPFVSHTGECQHAIGDSKPAVEEVDLKNQSLTEIEASHTDHAYQRCSAFVESKGRKCNRSAIDGGIFCHLHLNFRSSDNAHKVAHDDSLSLTVQTELSFPICQGMTKHRKRCTHRSRNGTSFCKKHMPQDVHILDDADATRSSSNSQKRDTILVEGHPAEKVSTSADVCHTESQNKQSSPSFSNMETTHGNISQKLDNGSNLLLPERSSAKVSNRSGNWSRCIGSCRNHGGQCSHRAKRGSSYCEKHLPSSLGLHHRYTESMLNDIFKNTLNEESHHSNFKNLLDDYMKSRLAKGGDCDLNLEDRGLDKLIGEASKDPEIANVWLEKVSAEKEKLAKRFGFEESENDAFASSPGISEVQKPLGSVVLAGNGLERQSPQGEMDVFETVHSSANELVNQKCQGCSEEFSDMRTLSHHCITNHKRAAERHFRGYACGNCSSSFTNKKGLERHVKIHHSGVSLEQCTEYSCIACGVHIVDCDQLWQHVMLAHPKELNQSVCIKEQVHYTESSKPLKVEQDKQDAVNPSCSKQDCSCEFDFEHKIESNHCNISTFDEDSGFGEKRTFARDPLKRFSCRFCGMKFSLLPDLGRHHQAKHMGSSSGNKPNHRKGKESFAAKWRANKGNLRKIQTSAGLKNAAAIARKKLIKRNNLQRSIRVDNKVQLHNQSEGKDRFTEAYLSAVANMLLSEGQKVRQLPNNLEILHVARLACCRANLQASLEEKYGTLSERLYVKAARLCSEENIRVEWHKEGFICSKGCKPKVDTQDSVLLTPVLDVCLNPGTFQVNDHDMITNETHSKETSENVESHLVLNASDIKSSHQRKIVVLLEDLSFGQETVPIPCVMDEDLIGIDGKDQHLDSSRPWEIFSYITDRLLDSSLGLDAKSSQLGCTCTQPQCSPESCDHVYLFENDNENAQDIYGKPINGRFPYDENGRIILEKGYLVYECNSMCSCQKECQNRILQNGVQVKLEVYKTKNKGWGVRAAEAICRGTFICEYIGEVLNGQEANKQRERYDKEGGCYLYDIGLHIDTNEYQFMEAPNPYVIDATKYGNVARFINHSCSPNLVNYQVLVESMDCQLAHIGLYSSRDIAFGEELAYDYNYKLFPGKGSLCHCGAENCRGRLY